MFVVIDTKGANRIVIGVPHEAAAKALPAIASMLESNATFINAASWGKSELVSPEMSIQLGSEYKCFDSSDKEQILVVSPSGTSVITDETFVACTNTVLTSNHAFREKKDKECSGLCEEISVLKRQLEASKNEVERLVSALKNGDDAEPI